MQQYTQTQLEQAFQKVQNKIHWKNPIDSICLSAEVPITGQAIEHFTATNARFTSLFNGYFRVEAAGYYAGPAN